MAVEAEDDGATPSELLLEASRRNNAPLASEVLDRLLHSNPPTTAAAVDNNDDDHLTPAEEATANLINTARTPTGLTPLHLCARHASLSTLDLLLDQPGVETDPLTPRAAQTPLHLAVEWVNEETAPWDWAKEGVFAVIEMLVDAGADPRVRDEGGMCPRECVYGENDGLRGLLGRAEAMAGMDEARRAGGGGGKGMVGLGGADVVVEEDENGDGERGAGSESESDD